MSDVEKYIDKRERIEHGFREAVETEFNNLRIGEKIRLLRIENEMTQEELAKKLHTTKSAISRLENHTESVRLDTLERVASVFNKNLTIAFD